MLSLPETELGFEFRSSHHLVFFGKKNVTLEQIKKYYPEFKFYSVHQKHTDICIESKGNESSDNLTADAFYTKERKHALLIKTADCIPAMVIDLQTDQILAIHAGWRGVENKIIPKSIEKAKIYKGHIILGPHIHQQSFEVDVDVCKLILKSINKDFENGESFYTKRNNKYFIDLRLIVEQQIKILEDESILDFEFSFEFLNIDTKNDLRFNSFRREATNSGRNLSFIVQL